MNQAKNTFRNESEADRILSMIERHCPRLMKTGGGSCGGGSHNYKVSEDELAQMIELRRQGKTVTEIAALVNYSVSTVSKHLRLIALGGAK